MSIAPEDLDLIKTFLEEEKQAVIDSQILRGIRATGESASMLRTGEIANGGQLIDGKGTFQYQESGRGPSKGESASGLSLKDQIYSWLELKKYGLNWSNDEQRNQMAWAIANKIHRKGTYTFIKGKPTGVLSDNINDRRIGDLMEKFSKRYSDKITSDIIGIFKKAS